MVIVLPTEMAIGVVLYTYLSFVYLNTCLGWYLVLGSEYDTGTAVATGMVRISVKLANGIAGKLLAALNNEGSDRGAGGAKTKGKPTHPHNSEKAGIEEDDDEYAGPSSLQYDAFHDGGRGE